MLRTFLRRLVRRAPPLLAPGTRAPELHALDTEGRPVTLAELAGRRVVLWFYPRARTPG